MPTKHKRKRDATTDKSHYDLPPTTKARSLPVIAPTKDFLAPSSAPRKRQKIDDHDVSAGGPRSKKGRGSGKKAGGMVADDTPKAFARLMAWHTQGRKIGGGLDDGNKKQKQKQQRKEQQQQKQQQQKELKAQVEGEGDAENADADAKDKTTSKGKSKSKSKNTAQDNTEPVAIPKIQPGETLAEYGLRVDQSLPLSSLPKANVNANASLPADLRDKEKKSQKLTRHNKRLARMQSEWRNTEAKLKSREEEELEENEEKMEEERLLWEGVKTVGKKGKKRVVEDDPWKELEKKRRAEGEQREKKKKVALTARDHAQAPPEFNLKKLNPFKQKLERPGGGSERAVSGNATGTASKAKVRRGDEMDAIRRSHIEAAKRSRQSNQLGVAA